MLWFFLSLVGAFSQATKNAYNKKLIPYLGVYFLPGIRALAGGILFLLVSYLFTGISPITYELIKWIIITLIPLYFANIFLFKGLKTAEFSVIYPTLSLTPLFTFITAYIALGETATLLDIIGVTLICIGIFITSTKEGIKTIKRNRGLIFGFITALLYSIASTGGKKIILESNITFGFGILSLLFSLMMLITSIIKKERIKLSISSVKDLGKIIFASFIENISINYALPMTNVAYVMSIKRTSSLFSLIYAKYMFKEKNLIKSLVGIALTIIGTILLLL